MRKIPFTIRLLLATLLARQNLELLAEITYLRAEVDYYRDQAPPGRRRFNAEWRRRFAEAGAAIGWTALHCIATVAKAETIRRWHCLLKAGKVVAKAVGRPRTSKKVEALILRMAKENQWGQIRISGELKGLGHVVCPRTVAAILRRHGYPSGPRRFRAGLWKCIAQKPESALSHHFIGSLSLDSPFPARESKAVMQPDHQKSVRCQPTRLVFHGDFCLWAKLRRPPDSQSLASSPAQPQDPSGGGAVVMSDGAAAAQTAANPARIHGSEILRRWSRSLFWRTIPQSLMGPLAVVMPDEFVQYLPQILGPDDLHPPQALPLHSPHPTLGKAVETGTVGRDRQRLDAGFVQDVLPGGGELGVAVVDEVPRAETLEESTFSGLVFGRLHHESLMRMIGHAQDAHLPRGQVDGEQDVECLLPNQVQTSQVKKSVAQISSACSAKNGFQRRSRSRVGEGPMPLRVRIAATVRGAMRMPSLRSSPTIRICPQPAFSWARRRTRASISGLVRGRPVFLSDTTIFPASNIRCQARIVLALATTANSPRRLQPTASPSSAKRRRQATVRYLRGRGTADR